MKKLIAITFLFITLFAQAQDRMTPELLWKLGRVSGGSISQDGKMVLYGVTYYDMAANKGNRDLYVLPIAGGEPKQITSFKGSEFNECWLKDGSVAFLSAESGSVQVWNVKTDGSAAVAITDIGIGINSFFFSADESMLVYTQDVKLDQTLNEKYPDLPKANAFETQDLMYRHWNQWHDFAYSHVFVSTTKRDNKFTAGTDVLLGERFDSPLNPFGGIEQIALSNDKKYVVYTCKKKSGIAYATSTNSDLYKYDIETRKTTNLTPENFGYDLNPSFSPDGKFLAYQSMKRDGNEADKNDIILYDLATGTKKNLTAGFDITTASFIWSKDSKFIYFLSPTVGTEQIQELNLATGKMRQISKGDFDYTGIAYAGKEIVGTKQSMNFPNELFKIDLKTLKETQLTFVNRKIYDGLKIGKIEKRWITTSDNKKMLTWVIFPPDFDPKKKYPTLLYCQGGPQSTVSQFFSYRWNFQLMAANGYIIVAPNRRGLPSFGQEWNDQISKDWGGQAITDYLTAIDTVAAEPYVDKDKLGAVGASYGGYSVYYLAGKHNKRFKTFVSHCGLFNLESFYGTTEELFFANWDLGGSYFENNPPKSYEEFSPHKFAKSWDTPILVIHGEKDFRVPFNQGMEAFQTARILGIQAKFLSFPEEGHWVMSPQNSLLWQREYFAWLDKWLK